MPRDYFAEGQEEPHSGEIAMKALQDVMAAYGLDWREYEAGKRYLAWNATEGPMMLQRLRREGGRIWKKLLTTARSNDASFLPR